MAFLWKRIPKRLKKYKKGPFDLFIEIMTLAINIAASEVSESQVFAGNCIRVF